MVIVIFLCAMVAYGRNRDHRAPRVAEAVVTHRTRDKPADADMLLCSDDE